MAATGDYRLALVGVIVIAVAMRFMYLAQPMRYDEAVTYLYFVRLPWSDALSTYTYPNNHLFHTLLVKASASVFGAAPWALRLPAFVAGILVVPATFAVARSLYGARAALIAAALVASSGILVLYSTNARGYMLVVLAFLALVQLAIRLLKSGSRRHWVAFAVIAALGLWTIPVMLYPLGTAVVWFALEATVEGKFDRVRPLIGALGVAAVLSLAAYAPVIAREGISSIVRNRFVTPSGWQVFLRELPDTLGDALYSWGLGIPRVVSLVLLALAVIAIVRHSVVASGRIGLHVAALIWCLVLLVVIHRAPFPRIWLWVLPIAASLAGAGLRYLAERWLPGRRVARERLAMISIALCLGLAASTVTSFEVLLSRDTGTFRDAKEAAAALGQLLRPGDHIRAGIPTNAPLEYYLDRGGVDRTEHVSDERLAQRVLVVVDSAEGQTLELLTRYSAVRDSSTFAPPVVVATLPASRIYLFDRKRAAH
jgi:4-amino-4-deoxy-L-arabinose transferase-like glycosyltransferase